MKCKCDSCGKMSECQQQANFGVLRWLCSACKFAANEVENKLSGKTRAQVAYNTYWEKKN